MARSRPLRERRRTLRVEPLEARNLLAGIDAATLSLVAATGPPVDCPPAEVVLRSDPAEEAAVKTGGQAAEKTVVHAAGQPAPCAPDAPHGGQHAGAAQRDFAFTVTFYRGLERDTVGSAAQDRLVAGDAVHFKVVNQGTSPLTLDALNAPKPQPASDARPAGPAEPPPALAAIAPAAEHSSEPAAPPAVTTPVAPAFETIDIAGPAVAADLARATAVPPPTSPLPRSSTALFPAALLPAARLPAAGNAAPDAATARGDYFGPSRRPPLAWHIRDHAARDQAQAFLLAGTRHTASRLDHAWTADRSTTLRDAVVAADAPQLVARRLEAAHAPRRLATSARLLGRAPDQLSLLDLMTRADEAPADRGAAIEAVLAEMQPAREEAPAPPPSPPSATSRGTGAVSIVSAAAAQLLLARRRRRRDTA